MNKFLYVLLILTAITTLGAASDEIIIIIKKSTPQKESIKQNTIISNVQKPMPTLEEVYARWEKWPGQMMLDSPSGPKMMLGMDVVYDQNGLPVPRLPDPYTYRVMKDPDNFQAYREYLDWRKAVIRRTRVTMNRVPDAAIQLGYVTAKTVEVGPNRPYDNKMVGDLSKIEASSLGTPLFKADTARELGVAKKDNPIFPGTPPESGISIYWFWHQRCSHCKRMARGWYAFQRIVNDKGYEAIGINMSKDNADVAAALEIFQITWGDDVRYSKNWLDWTDLKGSLNITSTPVIIVVNRKTNKMLRLDGYKNETALRAAIAHIGEWDANTWPPPQFGTTIETPPLDTVQKPLNEQATPLGTFK